MTRYVAVTKEDVAYAMQFTEEQLQEMPDPEFLDLIEMVLGGLFEYEQKVKDIKTAFARMQKSRLNDRLADFEGQVVELGDIVMERITTKPSVNKTKLLALLIETQPELQTLIDALTPQAMGKPGTQLKKYPREKEPAAWKKKPHKPLRESALPALRPDYDPRWVEDIIDRSIPKLQRLIAMWTVA